jgi:hypothetical protein
MLRFPRRRGNLGPIACEGAATVKICLALLLGLLVLACGGPKESIVPTVALHELTPQQIDQDPVTLLPGGFVGFARLEASEAFKSPFGASLITLATQLAPLPPSTGFVIDRDLERVFVGLYSMQGVDLAGVAIGKFDEAAIRAAAQTQMATTGAASLVLSLYAGRTLYTVSNMGFCILTARTALFGSEIGIRRALDRIREGRAIQRLPAWTKELLDSQQAPIGVGVDLRANVVSESVRRQLGFVDGLDAARARGNFAPPGLNLAASLRYPTAEQAKTGADRVTHTRDMLSQAGFLMTLFGIAQPIERLEARPNGPEVDVVLAANGASLGRLISQATPSITAAAKSGVISNPGAR